MSPFPKLKIKLPASYLTEELCGLEDAKDRLNFGEGIVMVEGRTMYSYRDLVDLANQDN